MLLKRNKCKLHKTRKPVNQGLDLMEEFFYPGFKTLMINGKESRYFFPQFSKIHVFYQEFAIPNWSCSLLYFYFCLNILKLLLRSKCLCAITTRQRLLMRVRRWTGSGRRVQRRAPLHRTISEFQWSTSRRSLDVIIFVDELHRKVKYLRHLETNQIETSF